MQTSECICCRVATKGEVEKRGLNHSVDTFLTQALQNNNLQAITRALLQPSACVCCRFVTKAEVEKLGLTHLVGTSLMRAYMHGYFVDNRLWHKARALAEPFAYDTYRAQRVQEKLEQERKSRIGVVKKLPKVSS